MMNGAVIRSMKYSGSVPRGSVVVFDGESAVKLPTGAAGDRLCGVYSEYQNGDAVGTEEALPITVLGPAQVCVAGKVSAGQLVYSGGTTGKVTAAKEAGSRLIGRVLEDGSDGDYVLILVQMGE